MGGACSSFLPPSLSYLSVILILPHKQICFTKTKEPSIIEKVWLSGKRLKPCRRNDTAPCRFRREKQKAIQLISRLISTASRSDTWMELLP